MRAGGSKDFMVEELGWLLLDEPSFGDAILTKSSKRRMTKAQKEALFDYYIKMGRHGEANKLYEEDY